jgi:hypothetical protein
VITVEWPEKLLDRRLPVEIGVFGQGESGARFPAVPGGQTDDQHAAAA